MHFRSVLDGPKGFLSAILSRLEPQPRGAVTRRAVAQRRSLASGLTRLSAEAISDSAWTGFHELAAQRFSKRNVK